MNQFYYVSYVVTISYIFNNIIYVFVENLNNHRACNTLFIAPLIFSPVKISTAFSLVSLHNSHVSRKVR